MDPREEFLAIVEAAITTASREYQLCQLAAQQADLEGEDLAAAVLRAVSETQTARVHALLPVLAGASGRSPTDGPVTAGNLDDAEARARRADIEAETLITAAEGVLDARGCADLRAALAPGNHVVERLRGARKR